MPGQSCSEAVRDWEQRWNSAGTARKQSRHSAQTAREQRADSGSVGPKKPKTAQGLPTLKMVGILQNTCKCQMTWHNGILAGFTLHRARKQTLAAQRVVRDGGVGRLRPRVVALAINERASKKACNEAAARSVP